MENVEVKKIHSQYRSSVCCCEEDALQDCVDSRRRVEHRK